MKLKEYITQLRKIANEFPNLEVVYSADDEGNSFSKVNFHPMVGEFIDGEFSTDCDAAKGPNAVCIN